MGTIGQQLELKGDGGETRRGFSTALALAFVTTPLIGVALDRLGFAHTFAMINTLLLAVPILLLQPSLDAQVQTAARPLPPRVYATLRPPS